MMRMASLAATALVAWGVWESQHWGCLVDVGPLCFHSFNDAWKYGWPVFCMFQERSGDVFVPASTQIHNTFMPWGLAADIVAGCAIVMATFVVLWRACSRRFQFGVGFLFSCTTAVAALLSWWRVEYQSSPLYDPNRYVLSNPLAETPMMRLLTFRPYIYVPVLLGIICLVLGAMFVLRLAAVSCWRGVTSLGGRCLGATHGRRGQKCYKGSGPTNVE